MQGTSAVSIALYYISLLSGLGNIDDQNRNPTKNNREYLVGRPTTVQCTRCTFWYLAYLASNQLISTFFLLYIRLLSGKSCLFICRYRDYLPLIRLAHLFHPAPSGQSPLHFAFVAKARVNLSSSNLSSTFCPFSPVLSIFLWNWHTLSQSIRN